MRAHSQRVQERRLAFTCNWQRTARMSALWLLGHQNNDTAGAETPYGMHSCPPVGEYGQLDWVAIRVCRCCTLNLLPIRLRLRHILLRLLLCLLQRCACRLCFARRRQLQPNVAGGGDVCDATWLHNNGADVVNEDGGACDRSMAWRRLLLVGLLLGAQATLEQQGSLSRSTSRSTSSTAALQPCPPGTAWPGCRCESR